MFSEEKNVYFSNKKRTHQEESFFYLHNLEQEEINKNRLLNKNKIVQYNSGGEENDKHLDIKIIEGDEGVLGTLGPLGTLRRLGPIGGLILRRKKSLEILKKYKKEGKIRFIETIDGPLVLEEPHEELKIIGGYQKGKRRTAKIQQKLPCIQEDETQEREKISSYEKIRNFFWKQSTKEKEKIKKMMQHKVKPRDLEKINKISDMLSMGFSPPVRKKIFNTIKFLHARGRKLKIENLSILLPSPFHQIQWKENDFYHLTEEEIEGFTKKLSHIKKNADFFNRPLSDLIEHAQIRPNEYLKKLIDELFCEDSPSYERKKEIVHTMSTTINKNRGIHQQDSIGEESHSIFHRLSILSRKTNGRQKIYATPLVALGRASQISNYGRQIITQIHYKILSEDNRKQDIERLRLLAKESFALYFRHLTMKLYPHCKKEKRMEKTVDLVKETYIKKSSEITDQRIKKMENLLCAFYQASLFEENAHSPLSIFDDGYAKLERFALGNFRIFSSHLASCIFSDMPIAKRGEMLYYLSGFARHKTEVFFEKKKELSCYYTALIIFEKTRRKTYT